MNFKQFKLIGIIIVCYLAIAAGFYQLAGTTLHYRELSSDMIEGNELLAELNNMTYIKQDFISETDIIEKISLKLVTLGRPNKGVVRVQLWDQETEQILDTLEIEAELLEDGTYYEWWLKNPVANANQKMYFLTFQSECTPGTAPAIYYNKAAEGTGSLFLNEIEIPGAICFSYMGHQAIWLGTYYWWIAGFIGALLFAVLVTSTVRHNHGKFTRLYYILALEKKYRFLMYQLVMRDFKTKYKRSVLGYLWSFLNPLFTMLVQYLVFSTVFQSNIENFPVYLLSGIILFNFFSEAVGQGLSAIVGNTALITKVYVPKYIYPISKVLSCSINLLISMIPLLMMIVFTGTKITWAILLLPYGLICLLGFCIGMSLLLSSAMVFFRDTQYLWGIASLAWMYATPLFYPESIIPAQFKFIHTLNPMYYIVKFARCILINGISPDPILYARCGLCAMISLGIGVIVFKKTQNKFALYL